MDRLFLGQNTWPDEALLGQTPDQTLSRVEHTTRLDYLRLNTRPNSFQGLQMQRDRAFGLNFCGQVRIQKNESTDI